MRHFFSYILILITLLISVQSSYSGHIEKARISYYINNYKDAINHYHKALKNKEAERAEITYRIGLCYFMLDYLERLSGYRVTAKKENPSIVKVKTFRPPGSKIPTLLIGDLVIVDLEYYYLYSLGYLERSSGYRVTAKKENPLIFKVKTLRQPLGSMIPTLLIDDLVIVDLEYYLYSDINRNDVVVLVSPNDKKRKFFKRVVALPGETVEIKNKQLIINGRKTNNKKAVFNDPNVIPASEAQRDNFGPVTISDESYFVMGDNRDYSFDSRHFGAVDKEMILGIALVICGSTPSKETMENGPNRAGIVIQ